jgi:hypothetical protein
MSPRPRGHQQPVVDFRELAPTLEHIEMEVAREMVYAAPYDVAQECGLAFEAVGNAGIQVATRVDALMFNRAMGLGVERAASPHDVDSVLAYLAASGIPRFFVSVCPFATHPEEIGRWLTDRGLERHNHWAKLWRDASPPIPVNTRLIID